MALLIKPRSLGVMTKAERRPPGASLVLSAFGMFDLAAPDRRRFEGEQALWMLVAKELPPGRVFDIGLPKPQAEVLVAGHAAAAAGRPVPRMGLSWTFGGRSKSLLVTGDRFWRMADGTAVSTEPRPFLQMPLIPARCFGGPGHAGNPEGTGFRASERLLAQETVALPNIEIPDAAIRAVGDVPPSAAFGPMAPDDPRRLRHAGTYGSEWLKTRAPGLAADADPRLFLFAPEDQRLPRHLAGDEAYALSHFAADSPEISATLPGFRVRCFVGWVDPGKPVVEVPLRIDTLWLVAGARRGILVYRGALPVEDFEARDVADTLFVYESAEDEPLPAAHYLRIRDLRLDPENGHKHAFSEHQLAPPLAPEELEARAARRKEIAAARLAKWRDDQAWLQEKMLKDSGLPRELWPAMEMPEPEDHGIPMPLPEELASGEIDLAEILDAMEAASARIEASMRDMEKQAAPLLAASAEITSGQAGPEAIDRLFAALGQPGTAAEIDAGLAGMPDLSELLPEGDARSDVLDKVEALADWRTAMLDAANPKVDEVRQLELARARFLGLPEGRPFAELRSQAGDIAFPDIDGLLDLAALPEGAELPPPEPPDAALDRILNLIAETPEVPAGTGETIVGAFADIDDGLRRSFPNLGAGPGGALAALSALAGPQAPPPKDPAAAIAQAKAELAAVPATLEAALDEAEPRLIESMTEMRRRSPEPVAPERPLTPAVARSLGELILAEARGGLNLAGRDLAGADLRGFDLSGLDLSGAMLERACLDGARLAGSRLTGATLCGASLVGTDLSGCDLGQANLCKVDGREARFAGARIVGASLFGAGFPAAVFDGAEIEDFSAMRMAFDGASFRQVHLRQGSFMQCSLPGTDWTGASVEKVSFMDVDCTGIGFGGARLFEVGFLQVRAAGAEFGEADLGSVIFAGEADLREARFQRITSRQLSFQKADLTGASFERARLDGSCFIETRLSRANFRAASLRQALLSHNDLGGADLATANLFEAQLNRADLSGALLRSANLYGADLADAALAGADFTRANLGGTRLENPSDG
ncbi:DUF2169 family type VI secretion system accessory protein [Methylobacterium persicinum]|uniref:Uncharacterized protein YjbI with pentapeptide repeats n=1 Tax=Methylobacterium persicinum TaxID=374426 RepID=A0ABU0HKY8_9HYPH|nr:DUF2169 domain-containing protein [Methylobacterium persicinum]MDQ0442982.1 uncharacterized protein YjbI with pentapeptide repeats [Methylobacterium persicinum]GJE40226.1 hypothetical protein KHHGKMAE_4317 [Methylobacterium persicinum]